ncbi:MAG: hypothetical protein GY822_13375 [Deltaproteobacteria bacterium]|nr:hypothetical protein [Deltaproteobacteria bacterium]
MSFLKHFLRCSPLFISVLTSCLVFSACEDAAPYKQEIAELKKRTEHLNKELSKASKFVNNNARCELQVKRLNGEIEFLKKKIDGLDDKKRQEKTDALGKTFKVKKGQKLFATFETSMGNLHTELFWEKAPLTVANFVQLAEGTKEWTDPVTKKQVQRPFYNDTLFFRVIPGFMVQGGSPDNSSGGGPGYTFADEFHPDLRHDKAGMLSMANSGKDTNGSQFFITEAVKAHLDDKHTVFGMLVDKNDLKLLNRITAVEKRTSNRSRPKEDIVLKRVRIGRGKPVR